MKPPAMKTPALATVYLDNQPVGLMGDPKPRVSKVLAASGKRPESVQVLLFQSATDTRGTPLRLEDTLDRTSEPTKPIYLTSAPMPPAGTVRSTISSPTQAFPTPPPTHLVAWPIPAKPSLSGSLPTHRGERKPVDPAAPKPRTSPKDDDEWDP